MPVSWEFWVKGKKTIALFGCRDDARKECSKRCKHVAHCPPKNKKIKRPFGGKENCETEGG